MSLSFSIPRALSTWRMAVTWSRRELSSFNSGASKFGSTEEVRMDLTTLPEKVGHPWSTLFYVKMLGCREHSTQFTLYLVSFIHINGTEQYNLMHWDKQNWFHI